MKPLVTRLAPYEVFFPLAALGTAVDLVLTLLAIDGRWTPPAGLTALDWHAHEMLFGHVPTAFAGVMLTALPRWTRGPSLPPIAVVALAALFLAPRVAFLAAPAAPLLWVSPLAVLALAGVAGRRIAAAGDRRDYGLIALLAIAAAADGLFLIDAPRGDAALALRTGLAVFAVVAMVMGGRVAPALTRHLADKRGRPQAAPTPRPLEIAVFAVTPPALALWAVAPQSRLAAALLGVAALLHALRLATWRGDATVDRPPFLALHLGYAFLPLGLATLAAGIVADDVDLADFGVHAFGTGLFGLMCAAIMTSVVRRYSGKALTPSRPADLVVAALALAAVLRLAASLAGLPMPLLWISVAAWLVAYAAFLRLLVRDRRLPAPAVADVEPTMPATIPNNADAAPKPAAGVAPS